MTPIRIPGALRLSCANLDFGKEQRLCCPCCWSWCSVWLSARPSHALHACSCMCCFLASDPEFARLGAGQLQSVSGQAPTSLPESIGLRQSQSQCPPSRTMHHLISSLEISITQHHADTRAQQQELQETADDLRRTGMYISLLACKKQGAQTGNSNA